MYNHIKWQDRKLERKFNQDQVRRFILAEHNITSDTFLKYVYDQYTYLGGYRAIRKHKMRATIKRRFQQELCSKHLANQISQQLVELELCN